MYPFIYKVNFYDGERYKEEAGAGFAESYGKAAQQIEDYYGPDLFEIIGICLLEESPLITFSSIKTYNEIKTDII